RMYSPVSIL
nr:Chain CCC, Gag6V [Human immunodeficiency virus 1]